MIDTTASDREAVEHPLARLNSDEAHRAIARALAPGRPESSLPLPTTEQRAIIESGTDPSLVVAGAGSGKTQTMMLRILWLIAHEGVAPERILGLTFTRKAAGELRERIERGVGGLRAAGLVHLDEFDLPEVSTYNSYANAIYSQYALLIGREPDAILIDDPGAFALMREVALEADDPALSELSTSLPHIVGAALSLARNMRENGITEQELVEFAPQPIAHAHAIGNTVKARNCELEKGQRLAAYARLAASYERRKRDRGLVEFSDQVAGAAEILDRDPTIALELRDRSRYVILDEYQDTSIAQTELFSRLFHDHPVMAVGDPKQSIYGWRGASAVNMTRFHSDFAEGSSGTTFSLSVSWRNDRAVLDAANSIAAPLPEARTGHDGATQSLAPRPGAGDGEVMIEAHVSERGESRRIAGWFAAQLKRDPDLTAAVLVRSRAHMVPIAQALHEAGVPHRVLGLGGLLSEPEIVDLTSLLRVASDPHAGAELIRLLLGAHVELGLADLDQLGRLAKLGASVDAAGRPLDDLLRQRLRTDPRAVDEGPSIVAALDGLRGLPDSHSRLAGFSPQGRMRLRDFASLVADVRARLTLPLPELVDYAVQRLRLDIETVANPRRRAGRANIDLFLDQVAGYVASSPRAGIDEFVEWLELAEADDRAPSAVTDEQQQGVVQVTTMHSAKGLEWDAVALPQFNEDVLPKTSGAATWLSDGELPAEFRRDREDLPILGWRDATDPDELKTAFDRYATAATDRVVEEARRLAYVAITRARHRLLITCSLWRGRRSTLQWPSRFCWDLVDELTLQRDPEHAEPQGVGSEHERGGQERPGRKPSGQKQAGQEQARQEQAAQEQAAPKPAEEQSAQDQQAPDQPADDQSPGDPPAEDQAPGPIVLTAETDRRKDGEVAVAVGSNPATEPARVSWPRPAMSEGARDAARALGDEVRRRRERGDLHGRYDGIIDRLIAERAERQSRRVLELPSRFGASRFHEIVEDPQAIARSQARPMPSEPFTATLIGNLFHSWVESLYTDVAGGGALIDGLDIDDEDRPDTGLARAGDHDRERLDRYRATFLASRFARDGRRPVAVEMPIDAPLGDRTIVGKLDAVYRDGDGRIEIVDWKTGRAPRTPDEIAGRELQLMLYAHAYARSTGTPLEQISATLYYVAEDREIRVDRIRPEADLIELLETAKARASRTQI